MADEPEAPPPKSDAPTEEKPEAPKPLPLLSSLCPNDLGLKAGFWSARDEDPVRFRQIVGWLVVTNFAHGTAFGPFLPVVLNDFAFPTVIAGNAFPDYIGTFANALTPEEARAKFEQWRQKPGPGTASGPTGQPQFN